MLTVDTVDFGQIFAVMLYPMDFYLISILILSYRFWAYFSPNTIDYGF